jgi:hypothetical protein
MQPPAWRRAVCKCRIREEDGIVLTESEAIFDPLHLAAAIGHLTQKQRLAALVHADI